MKTRLLSVLLIMALFAAVLAGCTSDKAETSPESEVPEVSESAPVETLPEEAPPAEDTPEEPVEKPEPEPIKIQYPITEGTDGVLTMWTQFESFVFGKWFESFSEKPVIQTVADRTGILLEFTEVGSTVASEQYNLMVASEDYCDFIPINLYNGGAAQAYKDEVIIDLTPYIEQNAPDFWVKLNSYDDKTVFLDATTDGMYLNLCTFADSVLTDSGMFVRKDWLDKLGVEAPTDKASLETYLYAAHDQMGSSHTYPVTSSCTVDYANSFFDTALFAISGTDLAMYLVDGQVTSGLTTDNYREYLEWIIKLYNDGIIHKDFYASAMGRNETMALIGDNNMAIWQGMADHKDEFYSMAKDPDFDIQAVPILKNDDGLYTFGTTRSPVGGSGGGGGNPSPCITNCCEEIEAAVQFLNYFYTEEGSMLGNYGVEGETYNLGPDGEIVYTDLILANPNGMNSQMAFTCYGWNHSGMISYPTRNLDTYPQDVKDIITMWSDTSYTTYDHTIPSAAALDVDETNSITTMVADISSYASEQLLKFITGTEPLNDDSWAAYVEGCNSFGLETCVEVYQKAYDDYLVEIA